MEIPGYHLLPNTSFFDWVGFETLLTRFNQKMARIWYWMVTWGFFPLIKIISQPYLEQFQGRKLLTAKPQFKWIKLRWLTFPCNYGIPKNTKWSIRNILWVFYPALHRRVSHSTGVPFIKCQADKFLLTLSRK